MPSMNDGWPYAGERVTFFPSCVMLTPLSAARHLGPNKIAGCSRAAASLGVSDSWLRVSAVSIALVMACCTLKKPTRSLLVSGMVNSPVSASTRAGTALARLPGEQAIRRVHCRPNPRCPSLARPLPPPNIHGRRVSRWKRAIRPDTCFSGPEKGNVVSFFFT